MAFIYDVILLFRLLFPHKNFLISAEDLFYWSYTGIEIFKMQLEQTDGVLRGFSILGMACGIILYNKLLGERMISLAGNLAVLLKRRLTETGKMLRIKLGKNKFVLKMNRRKDGRKKHSCKNKKTKPAESSGNDFSGDGSVVVDGSSGGKE